MDLPGSSAPPPTPLPTDRTYTGQEQDVTGLMYYHARYYDGSLGTFISPDTVVPSLGTVIDYNRFTYSRANPLRYNDPSGHASCAAGDDACWQARWYKAHGLLWGDGNWGKTTDAFFADADILNDVLGEAGIIFANDSGDVGWDWSTQQAQMSAIGQGIVKFGNKLLGGLAQLRNLLGGGAKLHHVAKTPVDCFGGPACAPPRPNTLSDDVYFSTNFLNTRSLQYIAQTAVHELAHVIDWHSQISFRGGTVSFSTAWHGGALTGYANCKYPKCINSWERWAEAVTTWVYGSNTYGLDQQYYNSLDGQNQMNTNADYANDMGSLLNGGGY